MWVFTVFYRQSLVFGNFCFFIKFVKQSNFSLFMVKTAVGVYPKTILPFFIFLNLPKVLRFPFNPFLSPRGFCLFTATETNYIR